MPDKSILIAEDDDDVRQMLEDALARFGCEIHSARDGAAALALLKEVEPTLMILDLELPHVNGETIIREIQSSPKLRETSLIIATASPASYIRQFERYAMLVVQKPYQLALITDAVDKALNDED